MTDPTCIVITGATATGKTSLAIKLAKKIGADIISADSRQCFRELNIGVAKPTPDQLKEVPHYFISSHSIHERMSASVFEKYALDKSAEIFQHKPFVVMVGGTGLYIRAFAEGLDPIPPVPAMVRSEIELLYQAVGLEGLQKTLSMEDPLFFEKGEWQNPQRVMRALEVMRGTGRSIISFQQGKKTARPFRIIKIGLELPKEELVRNINHRVDQMMQDGLVKEVEALQQARQLNALRTVGYTEILDFLDGRQNLSTAVEQIRKNTWQYARRQMTWFRKEQDISWFHAGQQTEVLKFLQEKLQMKKNGLSEFEANGQ